jgi:threonine dehydratase
VNPTIEGSSMEGNATLAQQILGATLEDIHRAARNIAHVAVESPLLRSSGDDGELRFKAENLQPSGSFKIRCALNMFMSMPAERLSRGVVTASAGNFGLGVAFAGHARGVPVTVQ